jgi:membrane protein
MSIAWKDGFRRVGSLGRFLNRVRIHFENDSGTLLAAGIAFNALLCVVPALLLLTSATAIFLAAKVDIYDSLVEYIRIVLPGVGEDVVRLLFSLVRNKEVIGVIGFVGLLWTSARFSSSLRATLHQVFRAQRGRNFIHGKIYDFAMSVIAGILLLISMTLTTVLETIEEYGASALDLSKADLALPAHILPRSGAFLTSFFMFYLVYRYVPVERIRPSSAVIGAIVSTVLWGLATYGLIAYVRRVNDMSALYGSFGLIVVFMLWIYYSAVAFIVGAEVAVVREGGRA